MKDTRPTSEEKEVPEAAAEATQQDAQDAQDAQGARHAQQAPPAERESGMGGTMAIAVVAAIVVFVAVLKWPRAAEVAGTGTSTSASGAAMQNPGPPGGWPDWNDAQIKWLPYEEGLATAKREHKPILLVIHTSWCPHCKNYRGIFRDSKVVEQSAQFVMINVSSEDNPTAAKLYAPDGEYIPRTVFLSSEGVIDPSLKLERDRFKYFYDERDPSSLLGGMAAALKKLR